MSVIGPRPGLWNQDILTAERDKYGANDMEQFRSMYYNYELNWTQTEALRLALWIASKAYPDLADGIDVLNATRSVLTDKLTILWGLKLGKRDSREAFSDRWILAAFLKRMIGI